MNEWLKISGSCPKCRAVDTCFRCGPAIACWDSVSRAADGRVHVGRVPPATATYALFNLQDDTPVFPSSIPEFTVGRAGQ